MSATFAADLSHVQGEINQFLKAQLDLLPTHQAPLRDAMEYGLLLGGKRVRPFLVYTTGAMLGAPKAALDYAAAAIEAIHAYSLIHDDLPAMDNDDLRRGRPTCHIAFDEATAILAGDALQAFAFELLAKAPEISSQQQILLVQTLAQASGATGMCLGQSLDLISEHKEISLAELELIHRNKTGALLNAALLLGFLCSPHFADAALKQNLMAYGAAIGLAFQVQDDILDIEGNAEEIGKPVGSDLALDKSTYPKLLGLAGAKEKAQTLYQQALAQLADIPFNSAPLENLAHFVVNRKS